MPGKETMKDLQVVILCGGYGTRLSEETLHIPKPMVPIGNRPILWHIMKHYSHYGVRRFVLALGYKGNIIKEYFINYELLNSDFSVTLGKSHQFRIHNRHEEENWTVTLSDTGIETLKGGRIKRVERYIDGEDFMLTYGDGVSDVNLAEVYQFHKAHGKIGTLTGVYPPSRFGEIVVEDRSVKKFTEKPQASGGLINGGYFVLNRRIFDYLTEDRECDFEFGPLQVLAREKELMVYEYGGFWACMDTIRDVKHLDKLWVSGKAGWKVW